MTLYGVEEGKQPLIIINDKEVSDKEALSKIAPDRIKSFSIFFQTKAAICICYCANSCIRNDYAYSGFRLALPIGLYGKRGANGVILVTTRREGKTRVQDISTFTEIKATETNTVKLFPTLVPEDKVPVVFRLTDVSGNNLTTSKCRRRGRRKDYLLYRR